MKKIILLVFSLISIFALSQQSREENYIKKYALLAVKEMHKYKIPASITLAQGIIETGGGQSRLANEANNHFGIKCKENWNGGTIYHDDDAPGECFRKYNSVEDSYEDHSKFLALRPYYRKLFNLDLTDYKGWAWGLKRAGYATNPRYAPMLISKIEGYHLDRFDTIQDTPNQDDAVYATLVGIFGPMDRRTIQTNDINNSEENTLIAKNEEKSVRDYTDGKVQKEREYVNNLDKTAQPEKKKIIVYVFPLDKRRIRLHPVGRKYIVVQRGETLEKIAKAYDIRENRLLCYNDLTNPKDIKVGQYLFLEKKKDKGSKEFYIVQKGDTMYNISQKMGIKLQCLYWRNRMEEGSKANVGDVLYLRSRKPRT